MPYKRSKVPSFSPIAAAIKAEATTTALAEVAQFAEAEKDGFVGRIEAQDFPSFDSTPLTPAWKRRKEMAERDLRVMIATGTYKDSIRVFRRLVKDGAIFRIGFHHAKRARNLKGEIVPLLLDELARVHEFGSAKANVPARPHWRNHLDQMRERARTLRPEIVRQIVHNIRRRIAAQ